jgi:SAM-dependent methyltransferase
MAALAPLPAAAPEEELVLRCARLRPGEAAQRRIAELLAAGPDWTRVVRLALHHKVTPLLFRALARRPEVPAEIRAALRQHHAEQAHHGLALVEELLSLVAALERAGVAALPFKGPALAQLAYGSLAARLAGDLDLLVRPEDLPRVAAELDARGYLEQTLYKTGRPLDAAEDAWYRVYQGEYCYLRPSDGMVVEPHWLLAPRPLAVELDMAGIWERARPFPLAGRSVLGMALEDLVLALCIHGSKHEWTELRWIGDVAELAARHPGLDWAAAHARAAEAGCARMLRLGLALAERVLGEPLPAALRDEVRNDASVHALAAQVEAKLFCDGYDAPSVFRVSRFRLRMRERARDRVACLARTLGTPQIPHVRLLRLPPALHPLYALVTPAIDYVALPLQRRLATHLARGARSPQRLEALARLAGAEAELETAFEALAGGRLAEAESELAAGAQALLALGSRGLPAPDAGLDAALCRFGLLLEEDPARVLAELARGLAPGGRIALAAWAAPAGNPWLAAAEHAAAQLVGASAVPLAPLAGAFAARGALSRALRRAGFRDARELPHVAAVAAPIARAATRRLAALCAGLDPDALPPGACAALDASLDSALPDPEVPISLHVASATWKRRGRS